MEEKKCAGLSESQGVFLFIRLCVRVCVFSPSRECLEKFGDDIGAQVWDAVNECFDVMPIAATVDDRVSSGCTFLCTSLALVLYGERVLDT